MQRFIERKKQFVKALKRLQEALQKEEDDLYIDGTLQRFEFTFELAWKTLKDYIEYQGNTVNTGSPREIIQLAFKQGYIANGELWISMMLDRNSLSHLYDEEESRRIYLKIKSTYINVLEEVKNLNENIL